MLLSKLGSVFGGSWLTKIQHRFPWSTLTGKGALMNSKPKPEAIEPNNSFITRADEQLARVYREITSADEQLAHVTEQLSKLESDDARHPLAAPGRGRSRGGPALRGLTGLLLAACIFTAAFVFQTSFGDAARLTIARWAPQLSSTPLMEKPGPDVQTKPPDVQLTQPESQVLPPTTSTESTRRDAAQTSPNLAHLLQTMARDLATVEQRIEQLKASQNQMAADNAKAIEQFKANQEQMAQLMARASEQNLRPKTPVPPPRPNTAPARKPAPQESPD